MEKLVSLSDTNSGQCERLYPELSSADLACSDYEQFYAAYTLVLISSHPSFYLCTCDRSLEIWWRLLAEATWRDN
jgi:hypothetical protein